MYGHYNKDSKLSSILSNASQVTLLHTQKLHQKISQLNTLKYWSSFNLKCLLLLPNTTQDTQHSDYTLEQKEWEYPWQQQGRIRLSAGWQEIILRGGIGRVTAKHSHTTALTLSCSSQPCPDHWWCSLSSFHSHKKSSNKKKNEK